jgi:hypothetical protein
MVYAYVQDVPIDDGAYRRIVEKLAAGPLPGLVVHLCVRRPDGGLRYIDVWESEEACDEAFRDRIHPAVYSTFQQLNFTPDGEPSKEDLEIVDVRLSD